MTVRTRLPWWGRGAIVTLLCALVGGIWWWAFDFGQIFGVAHRHATEERLAALETENSDLRSEGGALRARSSQLESELAMARGANDAIAKQTADLSAENAQLKEQTAFLQQLLADSNKAPGMSMPRLAFDRQSEDVWHYSLLIVRGGNPRDEFAGRLVLQATLQGPDPNDRSLHMLTLPDGQADTAPMLKLAFKYYQRVEGTFHVPPGTRVTALEARAFETGSGSPQASRTVTGPLTNP
jgi:hypothetical protein